MKFIVPVFILIIYGIGMYIGYKIGYRDGIDYENHKGHT
jgi:hypothetical protein